MKNDELASLVDIEISQAQGSGTTELSHQRATAMDYYLGEPFGNEIAGRSKVVSTDVQDTIEWIMPSLMRIFTSSNRAVEFDPIGPEDEDAARQETDIVNHVFYKENDGFVVLYSMFKDALLQKNGVVKTWWDDSKTVEREEYSGLNDLELAQLLSDDSVQAVEHSEVESELGLLHDVVINRVTSNGRVRVIPVPPEEFLISGDATCINPRDARFTCHRTLKTRSELLEMGFPKRIVKELPTYDNAETEEEISRDVYDDIDANSPDRATEQIRVDECYMRVDYDGDGVAELRQVTVSNHKILVNEPVDRIPFQAITPIIMPHKFVGRSVADLVMDIQKIKSTLLRGILDNVYLSNNSRTAAQEGMVNLDDLLTSRPGGVVRTLGPPSQVLTPLPASPLPPEAFEAYQLMELTRQRRTGVGQEMMGLESNVLAHGKTGVIDQSFDVGRMRVELIARIFAETGVKNLFLDIHRLLQQNQDKKKWMRIRNQWVPVDPSEWRNRENMTINVGLGTGNKDRILNTVMQVLGMQEKMVMAGIPVNAQHIFNAVSKFVEASDLGAPESYFPDPATTPPEPPKEPPPDPQMEAIKMQQQIETMKLQANNQTEAAKLRQKEAEALMRNQTENRKIELEDLRERTRMELEYSTNVPGALT